MRVRGAAAAAATLACLIFASGCRDGDAARADGQLVTKPAHSAGHDGDWQGGPEPVSGKLRSGIVSWWRLEPPAPAAGTAFKLVLRLEEVKGDDARASVTTSDGARLADPQSPREWALPRGEASLITLGLVAPAGDSYLHVTTRQDGRSSVRSIRIAVAGGAASAATRPDHGIDSRGEPIVRMAPAR